MNQRHVAVFSITLAGLLSACSPNPVLKERLFTIPPVKSAPAPKAQQAPVTPTRPSPAKPAGPATPAVQQQPQAEPEQSEPQVQKAPAAYPTSAPVKALLRQADREVAQNKLDKAASTLERALRIEPDNPVLWSALSKINALQGNKEQAASMEAKARQYQEQLN